MKKKQLELGTIYVFRGVSWSEPDWEFDAPSIVYSPVKRYSFSGDAEADIQEAIDEVCESKGLINAEWEPSDLKEFKWRGWSTSGFRRRKGNRKSVTGFFECDENGYWDWVEANDATANHG